MDEQTTVMTSKEMEQIHRSFLLNEVKEKIHKLKMLGLDDAEIMAAICKQGKLLKLIVNKDYRIILSDEGKTEIKMEPLVKAIYLLFLRHPEGIMFKRLPDYREELTRIYTKLRPTGMTDKALQSIEDVTNPLLNSINEKCARIRGAFLKEFDNRMAKSYYIDGRRGEPKKIALPRELVVWET